MKVRMEPAYPAVPLTTRVRIAESAGCALGPLARGVFHCGRSSPLTTGRYGHGNMCGNTADFRLRGAERGQSGWSCEARRLTLPRAAESPRNLHSIYALVRIQ